jgi:hypothetical protein
MSDDYYENTREQIRDIRRRIKVLRAELNSNTTRPSPIQDDGKVEAKSPETPAVQVDPREELKRKLMKRG